MGPISNYTQKSRDKTEEGLKTRRSRAKKEWTKKQNGKIAEGSILQRHSLQGGKILNLGRIFCLLTKRTQRGEENKLIQKSWHELCGSFVLQSFNTPSQISTGNCSFVLNNTKSYLFPGIPTPVTLSTWNSWLTCLTGCFNGCCLVLKTKRICLENRTKQNKTKRIWLGTVALVLKTRH